MLQMSNNRGTYNKKSYYIITINEYGFVQIKRKQYPFQQPLSIDVKSDV